MNKNNFALDNGLYNAVKWTALILLPALGSLYFGLGQIWNFPEIEKVVGSITVLDTFLGFLLRQSTKNYRAQYRPPIPMGDFVVKVDPEGGANGMKIVANQEFVPTEGDVVSFKVRREQMLE